MTGPITVTVTYIDEDGNHNGITDNPFGGVTHIVTETKSALDIALARERSYAQYLVNDNLGIAEPITPIVDCD